MCTELIKKWKDVPLFERKKTLLQDSEIWKLHIQSQTMLSDYGSDLHISYLLN